MIKEKRKKKKRFLHFLKILSIIIIVLALLFLIALKLFTVKQVEVDGNVLYDDETIENVVLMISIHGIHYMYLQNTDLKSQRVFHLWIQWI